MTSVHDHKPPKDHIPCVVIGAGPAGISAAQWLPSFEVPFRWFSTNGDVGGLLQRVHNRIENYPGDFYASGGALVEVFEDQLDRGDLSHPESGHVRRIARDESGWRLTFADRPSITADTMIVATGTRYRRLGVPGEAETMGTYVSQSATADAQRVAGETCAVVGGGDAGFENALRLAETGCKVWMLLRNDDFKARASFVERVQAHPSIEFHPFPTTVTQVQPDAGSNGLCRLQLDVVGRPQTLDVACLFVRIGVDPVSPQVEPSPVMVDGFMVVDRDQRTSARGIFAAGDITECPLRSVATAVGSGATAAKSVASYLGVL
jgi:thioredoxin reductase (NADPH)